jgi:hypothetical protein
VLCLGEVGEHGPELFFVGGAEDDEVVGCGFGFVDVCHAVAVQLLVVVFGHEGVVESQYAVGISFGDHPAQQWAVLVVEVHIGNQQQVALKLMVLFAAEQIRGDEEQFEFLEFVKLEYAYLVLWILVCAEQSPLDFG